MTGASPSPRNRFWGYIGKCIRLVLAAALYALIMWYGLEAAKNIGTPPVLTKIAVVLISLGGAGSTYKILVQVFKEIRGGSMVLADFLNRTLLEPQKRRDRERLKKARAEAHEAGRAEAMDTVRALMRENGLNPDDIIPPANGDRTAAHWAPHGVTRKG